jgi:hypothetical protein
LSIDARKNKDLGRMRDYINSVFAETLSYLKGNFRMMRMASYQKWALYARIP